MQNHVPGKRGNTNDDTVLDDHVRQEGEVDGPHRETQSGPNDSLSGRKL